MKRRLIPWVCTAVAAMALASGAGTPLLAAAPPLVGAPHAVPARPITMRSTQIAPNQHRITLPLSTQARIGASITFAVTGVQGAVAKDVSSLTGYDQ